jgi:hypothetical protein
VENFEQRQHTLANTLEDDEKLARILAISYVKIFFISRYIINLEIKCVYARLLITQLRPPTITGIGHKTAGSCRAQ